MDSYSESYQNGGSRREADLQGLAQNIGTNIQKILQNVSSMQRMIAQIGTPQDNQQLQNQLHQIQHYTGKLAKDTATHLQDLATGVSALNSSEQRQWRLQRDRLQNDFTKALTNFQDAQRTAAQKEKEILKKAKAASGMGGLQGPGGQKNLIDIEEGQGQSQEEVQRKQQMLMQEEIDIEQLQERQRAINQLESDILDVNTIFKDLATLVHDQGEMIDSIEANVESTHVRVQEGAEQLRQAETYKNKARKKKLILGLILFIILAIIIGIIAWQSN